MTPRKVFATGFSNGADMVYRLAVMGLVDAAAPVTGCLLTQLHALQPVRPVAMIVFHGLDDQLSLYSGELENDDYQYVAVDTAVKYWCDANGIAEDAHLSSDGRVHRSWWNTSGRMPVER